MRLLLVDYDLKHSNEGRRTGPRSLSEVLRIDVIWLLFCALTLGACAQTETFRDKGEALQSDAVVTSVDHGPEAMENEVPQDPDGETSLAALNGTTFPEELGPPYLLNIENIVRLVFQRNPSIRASREEMTAAKYGLEEFRANLNRLEPFVETRTDLSNYPNRRGAFGGAVESVIGVENETFGGSVFSAEVGGSASRFEFDRALATQDSVETGAGALVRARAEIPFLGSRRRQNRIIAQAFQETTARKAQLDYLEDYRQLVDNALEYFGLSVYYQRRADVFQRAIDELTALYEDERVRPEDRSRILTEKGGAETNRNMFQARLDQYKTILLSYVALEPDDDFNIEPESSFFTDLRQGQIDDPTIEAFTEKARQNNPAFQVLNDAIRNTELQRDQAIRGRYDITTFVVGTLFPLGSETFDDRLNGWTVGGGVNVRLNDQRVLEATRKKAEARIRQFKSEIEAEEIKMRRQILTEANGIVDNERNRKKIVEVVEQVRSEYEQRLAEYFAGGINVDQLLETRAELTNSETDIAANLYNTANREFNLLGATGRIYELADLRLESSPALER